MAINYAQRYDRKVDERFTLISQTQSAVNNDFDFTGVNTVNVYSLPTAALNNYTMSGLSRYGTPGELQDEVQALTLTQDKSFTFTIDRRNYEDTMMVKEAGRALRRQLDEVIIPTVDAYRIARMAANAGTVGVATITNTNAYAEFLKGVAALKNAKAPLAGTFAFIGSVFYQAIRRDPAFVQANTLPSEMLVTGQVGMIDGIPLVFVPDSLLPAGTNFLITNRIAVPSPVKLAEYKVHDNPPGINGWLIEGRIYYDAFVLNNKRPVIYVNRIAA